ncbi:MAG: HAMP domain-containing sensor histidine kinase [Polyangiales bacterium]
MRPHHRRHRRPPPFACDHPPHHHHRHYCDPRPRNPVVWYFRAALHRRLFVAFGVAILAAALTVFAVTAALAPERGRWRETLSRASRFVGDRYAVVWRDPPARAELTRSLARTLDVSVWVDDVSGATVESARPEGDESPRCRRPLFTAGVEVGGATAGRVSLCARASRASEWWRHGAVVFAALAALWAVAGRFSRGLTRPLVELVRVVQDIGRGKLDSRARLARGAYGEVGLLATVVNDMAERIERQVALQRELLAAVSHELRSPLARMRFELEALRDPDDEGTPRAKAVDEMERELEGVDALVGDLLATSRMDFGALRAVPSTLARWPSARWSGRGSTRGADGGGRRRGLRGRRDAGGDGAVEPHRKRGEARRARGRAAGHGRRRARALRRGRRRAGLRGTEVERAFEPFWRGDAARRGERAGVGLGLALVKRIAEVHGGSAWAENRAGRGARVGVELPRVVRGAGDEEA